MAPAEAEPARRATGQTGGAAGAELLRCRRNWLMSALNRLEVDLQAAVWESNELANEEQGGVNTSARRALERSLSELREARARIRGRLTEKLREEVAS